MSDATRCRRASSRRLAFDCELASGHTGNCSPFTVRPNPAYHARPGGVMADHRSHPDQLMARALGVCWHSPGLSSLWACTPLADWEIELLRGQVVLPCSDVHGSGEACARERGHDGHHHAGGDGLGWV